MKKLFLPVITLLMILLTTAAYIQENNIKAPQYKEPSISIESQKFGTVKKFYGLVNIWVTLSH